MADVIEFNKKLKFSWGHIVSFLTTIAIAYCTYIGCVYLLSGHFILSGVITFVCIAVLILWFLTVQQLKGTDEKFSKRIKFERAFVFLSPLVFLLMMIPFYHAWTVQHRQSQVVSLFQSSIQNATGMFSEYEKYSQDRINAYNVDLNHRGDMSMLNKVNKQETLNLILKSSNYNKLKQESSDWVSKATQGKITTWNVFLLGNITEIKKAVENWHKDLQGFSNGQLSDEPAHGIFDEQTVYTYNSQIIFQELSGCYQNVKGFNPIVLILMPLAYLLLLFPYLIQERNSKTIGTSNTLFGLSRKERNGGNGVKFDNSTVSNVEPVDNHTSKSKSQTDDDTFVF